MEKNLIALVGDLHFSGSSFETVGAAWEKVVDTCINEKVSTVFLLGDIFDSANIASHRIPLGTIIDSFNKPLLKLAKNNINVFILVGNHDLASSNHGHSLTYLKDINPFIKVIDEPEIVTVGTKKVGMFPWIKNQLIKEEDFSIGVTNYLAMVIDKFKKESIDILTGHIELSNYNLNSYRMVGNKYSVEQKTITDICPFIYLGHYHKGDEFYVGSLTHLTFNDCGNIHGFIIQDLLTNKVTKVNIDSPEYKIIKIDSVEEIPVELDTFNQYRLDINDEIDLDNIKKLLADNVQIKLIKKEEKNTEEQIEEISLNEIALFEQYAVIKNYEKKVTEEVLKRISSLVG